MEQVWIFKAKFVLSTAKLIDNNIGNTLHWAIQNNEKQEAEIVAHFREQMEKRADYDPQEQDNDKFRRLSLVSQSLDDQRPVMEAFKAHFKAQYKEDWKPRETSAPAKTVAPATLMAKYGLKRAPAPAK
jgi:hypothetical protein